jgi:precorrin-2 dehydrogenase / sirohydrochlorin ferrochelatase
MNSLFPMFVKLEGRRVLVVGAGNIGEQKIAGLLDSGARVRVIALSATEQVRSWAEHGSIDFAQRTYESTDLDGVFLVIVASSVRELNEQIYREAQDRGILCNVVDVPDQCDFYYPSVVKRGDLQIAISTSGQSPSLAQRIRRQLEQQFGPTYADWVSELGDVRREVLRSDLEPERKRDLLQSLASRAAFEAEVTRQQAAKLEGGRA